MMYALKKNLDSVFGILLSMSSGAPTKQLNNTDNKLPTIPKYSNEISEYV